jgi:WD repeat-containing protein 61
MSLAFSPDGGRLAAGTASGKVAIIDVETMTATPVEGHSLSVRSLAWSHDGLQLFSGSDDQRIHVFDASAAAGAGASLITSLSGHFHWVTSVCASPDKHILASGSADKTLKLWDVRKRECMHTLEGSSDKIWAVAFDPAGTRLAAATEAGE